MISISTIGGIILAILVFSIAIMQATDNYLLFISISSLLIVLGGTFAAALIAYNLNLLLASIKNCFLNILAEKNLNKSFDKQINRAIELSFVFQNKGVNALESELSKKEKRDKFISLAIDLIYKGYTGQDLYEILIESSNAEKKQASKEVSVLNTMAAFAPGFGMIGTLIGLITMLDNMQGNLDNIGKGLSVALLTTLYGTLLAQILFKPAATKALRRINDNYYLRELQAKAFKLITTRNENIEDLLSTHLSFKYKRK